MGCLLFFLVSLTTCGKDSPTGPPVPSTITVTPASATLTAIGQTVQLNAGVVDRNRKAVAGATVTWTSSNASVTSVSPTGLVTAHQTGTSTIKATSSGVSGQAIVKVETPVVTSIVLTAADTLLTALGQTKRINASVRDQKGRPLSGINLNWSTSDTTVVYVDSTGLVTAVGNGIAEIVASSTAAKGKLQITVMQRANAIRVSETSLTMVVGISVQLIGTVIDANGHPIPMHHILWLIPSRSVIRVDQTGLVTALHNGSVTIEAIATNTIRVLIWVTVVDKETVLVRAVTVTPSSFTMALGDNKRLKAEATDLAGNVIDVPAFLWRSSDESVASVDSTGLVTALRNGRTIITAFVGNKSGRSDITVIIPEEDVLAALFETTNGPEWSNRTGWLSDAPVSEWYGVLTDEDGRVTGLHLNGNNLSDTLPFELGELASLESLDLGENALEGPLPYTYVRLNLRSLRLDDTGLCAPSTTEMGAWLQGIPDASQINYCESPDRKALIALYNATDGPNWRR